MKRIAFLLVVFPIVLSSGSSSRGAIVYDAPLEPFAGGGIGFLTVPEVGQAISLDGTSRAVTKFEVGLSGGATTEFRVRFYELDGRGGGPGSLIWESPPQVFEFFPPINNRRVVGVTVPSVDVPDSFAWAVAITDYNGPFGVRSVNPPAAIGTVLDGWWKVGSAYPDYPWSTHQFDLSARVTAVPEPGTLSAISVAVVMHLASQWIRKRR